MIWLLVCVISCPTAGQDSLAQDIRKLINQPAYQKTQFSILVYNLDLQREVYSYRADRPLVPASNMKLVTTAAAVATLGGDFHYETVFGLHHDNLVIVASGDPLLGDPVLAKRKGESILEIFEQVLGKLKEREIKEIPGDLVIDATIFDDERFHPSWPQKQADKWYTAQIDALNFNNNCLDVTFIPASVTNQPVKYIISPKTSYVSITNKCKTIKTGKSVIGASRVIGTNDMTLRGKCRLEQTISVTIDRPSAFFAHAFAEYLLSHNIEIKGKLVIPEVPLRGSDGQLPGDFEVVHTYSSSLTNVLDRCNQDSLNMVAECLIKTIGVYYLGEDNFQQGTWPSGKLAVQSFLKKCGSAADQFAIDDGSGLSKANRLSARCLAEVLICMNKHEGHEMFRASLATPQEGTLRKSRRFSEPTYQERLFAKTGYVSRAWALSGYCQNKEGQWLAFSILANKGSQSPRQTLDQIVKRLMK